MTGCLACCTRLEAVLIRRWEIKKIDIKALLLNNTRGKLLQKSENISYAIEPSPMQGRPSPAKSES